MRRLRSSLLLSTLPALLALSALSTQVGCAGRSPYGSVSSENLGLTRVVLYRNGVGYFERRGKVDGDVLRLRVRKDQVNDLLKSLTVVDEDGKAVSISMPLDPRTWATTAMATLAPGRGSLAQVLDSLRGTEISVTAGARVIRGRIVMVERSINEPDPELSGPSYGSPVQLEDTRDWKLTLLSGSQMKVVRLSKIKAVSLHDGDLAMQLHRSLDASAGEGMFEQVTLEIRLTQARSHRLEVSYVVASPMWKPTYRVVLPEGGKGKALLQGWAVIDNVSGEDWKTVSLSLTSGAPISFRYDLHTPREVYRSDMTESGVDRRATVALGETSWARDDAAMPEPEPAATGMLENAEAYYEAVDGDYAYMDDMDDMDDMPMEEMRKEGAKDKRSRAPRPASKAASGMVRGGVDGNAIGGSIAGGLAAQRGPSLDLESLQRSTAASARSQRISGLTRIDLDDLVTVPDGTSTMVAIINESVAAEQTFLFRPGGAGYGYEANPYRVLRFQNSTEYVLEPGPISIYSGGSFVGEGLSEAVGAGTSVTIPFAVEPGIMVTSSKQYSGQEMTLTRIVRGVLEVESFYQTTTTWDVRGPAKPQPYQVLLRQPQSGPSYALAQRPEGTEDLEGAWLIPLSIPAKARSASLSVVEQTPSTITLAIWDAQALDLLENFLSANTLDAAGRKQLQPVVDLRREIGRIDTVVDGLRRQQTELERRADQTRRNLKAIKKDSKAGALRSKLNKRLEEFSSQADEKGRQIVSLESERLEKKIGLEDLLQDLDLRAPGKASADKSKTDKSKTDGSD